jgi:S-adenosylmethionine hydrolase
MAICTLLTDFGLRDYYVGAVKGTLLKGAPGSVIVDLTHQIEAGDVEGAAWVLAAALPSFPAATVHLAVVDPGVGSRRRLLAARVADQYCVAPDNGLLTKVFDGAQVHAVDRRDLFLEAAGATFDGRDRFAPISAYLLRGGRIDDLGPIIDDPVRLTLETATRNGTRIVGRVVHVDHFGNLVTNIPSEWCTRPLRRARAGSLEVRQSADYYAELAAGETAVLPGSMGTLEISMRDGDAAAASGLKRGVRVQIDLE